MSHDVSLMRDGQTVEVEHHAGEGGTYALGGSQSADLNITYNYSECYALCPRFQAIGRVRGLDGMSGADAIPILAEAVEILGTKKYADYWAPTPGNAGYALSILLGWARQHPDAVFSVS